MKAELILGAGTNTDKRVSFKESPEKAFVNPTTLDFLGDVDVVHDLNVHPLPFKDNSFDEIHAYEVLEHLSSQGNFQFFFAEFAEYWRILKPDGYFCLSVPMWDSPWSFADPGHTRVIPKEMFSFLDPAHYEQCGKSAAADYREWLGSTHFEGIGFEESQDQLYAILQAKKS